MKRMGRDRVECDKSVNIIIIGKNHYRVIKTCKRTEKCVLSSCIVTIFMQKKLVMRCTVYRMLDNPCKLEHCQEWIAMPKHWQSWKLFTQKRNGSKGGWVACLVDDACTCVVVDWWCVKKTCQVRRKQGIQTLVHCLTHVEMYLGMHAYIQWIVAPNIWWINIIIIIKIMLYNKPI